MAWGRCCLRSVFSVAVSLLPSHLCHHHDAWIGDSGCPWTLHSVHGHFANEVCKQIQPEDLHLRLGSQSTCRGRHVLRRLLLWLLLLLLPPRLPHIQVALDQIWQNNHDRGLKQEKRDLPQEPSCLQEKMRISHPGGLSCTMAVHAGQDMVMAWPPGWSAGWGATPA